MLRSIPPITSTGRASNKKQIKKLKRNFRIQSGVSGRILGQSFSIGNSNIPRINSGRIGRWKPKVYKKLKSNPLTMEVMVTKKKDINLDIFDEKDSYQLIINKDCIYSIKDDIITFGEKEEKEILIPKDVRLKTKKIKEKNGLVIISFKKKRRKKK